jgi:hypothetical protein
MPAEQQPTVGAQLLRAGEGRGASAGGGRRLDFEQEPAASSSIQQGIDLDRWLEEQSVKRIQDPAKLVFQQVRAQQI